MTNTTTVTVPIVGRPEAASEPPLFNSRLHPLQYHKCNHHAEHISNPPHRITSNGSVKITLHQLPHTTRPLSLIPLSGNATPTILLHPTFFSKLCHISNNTKVESSYQHVLDQGMMDGGPEFLS
ncbi:unnamed protein product [Vicia faba]|uniref:Uncharacterized protein n=1 Tax=Vicia faba TaxID=3906 RepID=A0AAV0Z5Z0_VICFA|nr:unnamed protein product [Vicia faba]